MKSIRLMLAAALTFFAATASAQLKTETFKVSGNCGMCKKRIEKAVQVAGVHSASWDVKTKAVTVAFDPAKITNEAIQKKIAAVGHDTEKFKADNDVYDKLPGCCLYDRGTSKKDDLKTTSHH